MTQSAAQFLRLRRGGFSRFESVLRLVRWRSGALIIVGALTTKCVLLLPWFTGPGVPVDEGAILSYGQLVLHGLVPGRDIRTLYGPLDPYLVGGGLWITHGSLFSERLIGLFFRLVTAGSLLLLVRRRGSPVLLASAAILLLMPPQGLGAFAVRGAAAGTAVATVCASRRRPLAAGMAAGVAVLFRWDWLVPVALGAVPWLVVWPWRVRLRALVGLGVVLALYVPWLVAIGASNAEYALGLLNAGETARRLPFASLASPAGALFYLVLAADALLVIAGLARRRTVEGSIYLSVALVSVGLLPYAMWTEDRAHVGAAAQSVIVAPAAVAVLIELARPLGRRIALFGIAFAVAIAPLVVLIATSVFFPAVPLVPPRAYPISNDGRRFYLDSPQSSADASKAVRLVAQIAPHGRLFVGPRDLSDPAAADDYLYYLLPALRPATFFIVVDPGTTDRPPHRLAAELPRADVLILDSSLPSATGGHMSQEANAVVARDFCVAGRFGAMSVFRRCHRPG